MLQLALVLHVEQELGGPVGVGAHHHLVGGAAEPVGEPVQVPRRGGDAGGTPALHLQRYAWTSAIRFVFEGP
jgi:hypothetical protein